jgi:C4-dicarboxylate-specific signal transduction histidine kinase
MPCWRWWAFIGIVVDEMRQVADELKHTMRLAAAGEMAAALAHELNQPLTALSTMARRANTCWSGARGPCCKAQSAI